MDQVSLGDRVQDKVTGLEGIAIGRHDYLYGPTRWSVQPPEIQNGRPVDATTFDDAQLMVVEKAGGKDARARQ